jgi:transposase
MLHYVGLDVSMKTTFVCIVNEKGKIVKEIEASSIPEEIGGFLLGTGLQIEKVGLESGCLTHYLKKGLKKMGFEVVGMESHRMAAILATIINKTDKNDARGIAEALRVGHYKECVHRSDEAIERRTILHGRRTAVEARTLVITSIKGHLKVYGIKLGQGGGKNFYKKIEEAISGLTLKVRQIIESLLNILKTIEEEVEGLDQIVKDLGKEDERVKLLQTVDGVGPITALAFVAEIDDPKRFEDSKDVAAYIGLTPTQYSSGEMQRHGGISKKGSRHTRCLLVEAATTLLTRCRTWSKLKAWGLKLARKIGTKKAIIAVARKLAVTMHRMLMTGKPFERSPGKEKEPSLAA